jgi:hypothetical protein
LIILCIEHSFLKPTIHTVPKIVLMTMNWNLCDLHQTTANNTKRGWKGLLLATLVPQFQRSFEISTYLQLTRFWYVICQQHVTWYPIETQTKEYFLLLEGKVLTKCNSMYGKRQLMPRMTLKHLAMKLFMRGYGYKLPSKQKFTYNIEHTE